MCVCIVSSKTRDFSDYVDDDDDDDGGDGWNEEYHKHKYICAVARHQMSYRIFMLTFIYLFVRSFVCVCCACVIRHIELWCIAKALAINILLFMMEKQ